MPVDQSLVGATFGPTDATEVTQEAVAAFAAATGTPYDGGPVPPTYPIVLAFEALFGFLADRRIELSRIVHGDQRFDYVRPIVPGDVLTATLTVKSLRQIGGADIIGTASEIHDADGELVCTAGATVLHRGPAEGDAA